MFLCISIYFNVKWVGFGLNKYSGGCNIQQVQNSKGSGLFGFPMMFGFPIVDKMASSVDLVFKAELNLMLKVLRLLVKVWWA